MGMRLWRLQLGWRGREGSVRRREGGGGGVDGAAEKGGWAAEMEDWRSPARLLIFRSKVQAGDGEVRIRESGR